MSQADELLESLTESDVSAYTVDPESEPHIVIDADRFITVPKALQRLAVQYDHDIETVTFDCPRYWDGIDMSQMSVWINYKRSDKYMDCYRAQNVTPDESDESIMHFTWTVSRNVSEAKGPIVFLVCIKKADDEGNEVNHWNSELCTECYVSEGLECGDESVLYDYPDYLASIEQEYRASFDALKAELLTAKEAGEFDGEDGVSPTITVTNTANGHQVSVTDVAGTKTFEVRNGVDGDDGISPTIAVTEIEAGHRVSITDVNGTKTFDVSNGIDGNDGASINSVARTSGTGAAGTIDTYTITMSDGTIHTFQVYNGADGEGAGDMLASIYDTEKRNTDVFKYVDDKVSGIDAGDMTKTVYDPQGKNTDIFKYVDDKASTTNTTLTTYVDEKIGEIDTILDSLNGE